MVMEHWAGPGRLGFKPSLNHRTRQGRPRCSSNQPLQDAVSTKLRVSGEEEQISMLFCETEMQEKVSLSPISDSLAVTGVPKKRGKE